VLALRKTQSYVNSEKESLGHERKKIKKRFEVHPSRQQV
jgi:hypothetical protein